MTYSKPVLFVAGAALVAVQVSSKPALGAADSQFGPGITPTAYEADE